MLGSTESVVSLCYVRVGTAAGFMCGSGFYASCDAGELRATV